MSSTSNRQISRSGFLPQFRKIFCCMWYAAVALIIMLRRGPKRYDWTPAQPTNLESGKWIYTRDGSSIKELLDRELGKTLEADIGVPAEDQVEI